MIKGLRKAQEMLLLYVFKKMIFIFSWVGKGMKENIKKIVLSLVSKNTNQVFVSLVFAQVSSGSGVRKEGKFCEQISVMPRCELL